MSALNEAHSCGVFHRNCSCDNCLITDVFDLVLGDFGISKDRNLTSRSGVDIKTPRYMSPELQGIT